MSKKPTTLEELAAGASLTGATIPVATVPPVDALRAELISKNIKHAKDAKGDNVVKLRLELARHVPYVRLDNVVYYPGYEYDVKPEVAVVLKDQMYRSYLHDAEISGLNINDYLGRRTALAVVSG